MSELFTVVPPAEALHKLLAALPASLDPEWVSTVAALDRVTADPLRATADLPTFARSTMDGYAVRAADTYGASESLPAYLTVVGEAPMGRAPTLQVGLGQAALIHTGGMLPHGADAVVMVERTQQFGPNEIEVLAPVAVGENVLQVGEDIRAGDELLPAGHRLRPQDLGGLMAVGVTQVRVTRQPRVAILATGDEVVPPTVEPLPGQVRDINSYTLAGLVQRAGGQPKLPGIIPDELEALQTAAQQALADADALVISAGSSVSTRDLTAAVITGLGGPGILVHGIALKPGKPTILAVANGKPVFGLPGNPVSALIVAQVFLVPALWRLQGLAESPDRRTVSARLTRNVASAPGREEYLQVRLQPRPDGLWAEPIFGKSNLIYTLVRADGLLIIPLNANGLQAGDWAEVVVF